MIYLLHSGQNTPDGLTGKLPWMYLGTSYRELSLWRERLGRANQIDAGGLLADASDRLRPVHLQWLSRERLRAGDGAEWWLNWLQSRNTMVSPFFPDICAIAAIDTLIRDRSGPLAIICSDRNLVEALAGNLVRRHIATSIAPVGWLAGLGGLGVNLARAGMGWIRAIAETARAHLAARQSRAGGRASTAPLPGEGKTFLIRSCIDRLTLDGNGRLVERYFTRLPGRLEAEGHHVTILPWLYNFSGSLAAAYATFRRLRGPGCLIIEDHIRVADYFRAARVLLKGVAALGRVGDHDGIDIRHLIRREQWLLLRSAEMIRHIVMGYGLGRWIEQGGHCDVWVDMFENMPPERPAVAAFRRHAPGTLLIGYIHTLATKEFLGYHFDLSEWSSPWLPDRIVVNGPLAADLHRSQGVPADRVRTGPALRLAAQMDDQPPVSAVPAERCNILVVLPMTADSAAELAAQVFQSLAELDNPRVRVLVKKHPMCGADELGASSDVLRKLPEGWSWEARDLVNCLPDIDVCTVGMTGAVLDIALSGTPLVYVQREVGATGDYSALLGSEWPMARGVAGAVLASRLQALLLDKEAAFREAREMARRLRAGLGSLDKAALAAFLP
jgi:surface carbohydrate biosynthesis protein (TIGR04326 family)